VYLHRTSFIERMIFYKNIFQPVVVTPKTKVSRKNFRCNKFFL
jgi:hypothetical protein